MQVQKRQGEHGVQVEEGECNRRTESEQRNYNNKIGMVQVKSEVLEKGLEVKSRMGLNTLADWFHPADSSNGVSYDP